MNKTKKGNPEIKKHSLEPQGEEAKVKQLSVRVTEDVYAKVSAKGNDKTDWLRKVIREALENEEQYRE